MGEKINKEMLIELVRSEPALWNKMEREYNNRELKPELWERIGKRLNITGKMAQKSWETLRDSYRKIRKRTQCENPNQGVRKEISWPHYNAMCFLDELLPYSGVTSPKREPAEEDREGESEYYFEEENKAFDEQPRHRLKRKYEEEDGRKGHPGDGRRKRLSEADDDYLFLMSLLPYLRKLDDVQKMRLRMEILRSVTEELESSKYQEVSASSWHPAAFAVTQGPASTASSFSSHPATPGTPPDGR